MSGAAHTIAFHHDRNRWEWFCGWCATKGHQRHEADALDALGDHLEQRHGRSTVRGRAGG